MCMLMMSIDISRSYSALKPIPPLPLNKSSQVTSGVHVAARSAAGTGVVMLVTAKTVEKGSTC